MDIVEGDIVRATEQYICHQCNCVTNKAAHLAAYVFQHFPHADVYKGRSFPHQPGPGGMPGDIIVRGGGEDRPVIAMLGQYYPGKPRFPDSKRDGYESRKAYFAACLKKVGQIPGLSSVAFPYQIGCGAAGGNWPEYLAMLEEFDANVEARVRIYKLNTGLYKKIVEGDQFDGEQDVQQEAD